MLAKLRARAQADQGFTLIELLVVILIIGILAAIAIPSFLGQRSKADDAAAKSAVKTAQTAAETWFTDRQTYENMTPGELQKIEPTLDDASRPLTLVGTPNGNSYTVQVQSARNAGVLFRIGLAATGAISRTCTVPANVNPGGCKLTSGTTGTW